MKQELAEMAFCAAFIGCGLWGLLSLRTGALQKIAGVPLIAIGIVAAVHFVGA